MLHERDREVGDLVAWLAAPGSLLLVEGEPGVGKTSLVDAALALVDVEPVRLTAPAARRHVPYSLLREVVAVLGGPPGLDTAVDLLATASEEAASSAGDRTLAGAAARLGEALGGRLVVLDDVHWADPASLEVLARVVGPACPLLAASRLLTGPETHAHVRLLVEAVRDAVTIELRPLSPGAVATMAGGAGRTPGEIDGLVRRSGGVPLLVETLTSADGPTSLTEYVAREVGRWGAPTARVARALAVLSRGASDADLADVAGVQVRQVGAAIDRLRESGLLTPGPRARLRHPLLEEIVAGIAGSGAEADMRARAARRLHRLRAPRDEVVGLLVGSSPLGEAWAAEVLLDAARESFALSRRPGLTAARFSEVVDATRLLAARGLEERPTDLEVWGELTALRRRAALETTDESAFEHGEEDVLELRRRGALRWAAETRVSLVEYAMVRGLSTAPSHALRLAEEVDDLTDPWWQTRALSVYLSATYVDATLSRTRAQVMDEHRHLVHLSGPRAMPLAAAAAAAFAEAGRDREALEMLASVDTEAFVGHPERLIELGLVAVALVHLEQLDGAREAFGSVVAAAPPEVRANAACWVALIDVWSGRLDGVAAAEELLASGALWPLIRPIAVCAVLEGALLTQDDEALVALTERFADDARAAHVEQGPATGALLVSLARTHLALGDPHRALHHLERAEASYPDADWLAPWPVVRLQATLAAGRPVRDDDADLLREWATGTRPLTRVSARALLARLGRLADRGPSALDAARDLAPVPLLVELLMQQAATRRRNGALTEARDLLHEVRALADANGFTRVARAARSELRLAGGRAPSSPRPFDLTPAEQRVGILAANGFGNRQIAENLVLSIKTVESHMAKVLTKVGRSRADLAGLRAELGGLGEEAG